MRYECQIMEYTDKSGYRFQCFPVGAGPGAAPSFDHENWEAMERFLRRGRVASERVGELRRQLEAHGRTEVFRLDLSDADVEGCAHGDANRVIER